MSFEKVLVVGAGPSGLLLALMLARHNIKVDIVEQLDGLDERPRGAGYGSAAVQYGCLCPVLFSGLNINAITLLLAN